MLRKMLVLVVLVLGLSIVVGCNTQTGFSPTQNLRRVMIMGEQAKLMGQDFQRELDLEDYPRAGRWNY